MPMFLVGLLNPPLLYFPLPLPGHVCPQTAILDVLDEYDCSDYEPEIVSSLAREVCANMDNAGNRGGLEDAGGDSDTSKDKDKKKKKKKNKKAKREEARRQREAEMQAALGGGAAVVSSANSKRNLEEMGDDVIFRNFTIHMRGLMLFENASITLAKGFRYGLVGYNGAGKTTLLRQIARGEGEFALPPHIDILHVEQEIEPSEKSAIDTVMESDVVRMRLMAEAEELENLDVPTEQSEDRLAEVYELLEDVGAARAEARASAILSGLQFTEEMKLQVFFFFTVLFWLLLLLLMMMSWSLVSHYADTGAFLCDFPLFLLVSPSFHHFSTALPLTR